MGEMNVVQKVIEELAGIKAKEIMTTSVISTSSEEPLYQTALKMLKNKISGQPVMGADGKVVGIVTITDLFVAMAVLKYQKALSDEGDRGSVSVGAVMTEDVVTITQDRNLSDIIDLMVNRGIHTLPVVEDGKMIGVIGRRDVIHQFYSALSKFIK